MSKIPKSKSVTMLGGKNIASTDLASKKPPKSDPVNPESPETPTADTPEKPTE